MIIYDTHGQAITDLSDPKAKEAFREQSIYKEMDFSRCPNFDIDFFHNKKFVACKMGDPVEDYLEGFVRYTTFLDCRFRQCDFSSVNAAGAKFLSCVFVGGSFQGFNLTNSVLHRIAFEASPGELAGMIIRPGTFPVAEFDGLWNMEGIVLKLDNGDLYPLRHGCIAMATRSDGHTFRLWDTKDGLYITAGCRFFNPRQAMEHWTANRFGTSLGNETFAILNLFRERALNHNRLWA